VKNLWPTLRKKANLQISNSLYLDENPDVKAAVESGVFVSGREHWIKFGKNEGRLFGNTLKTATSSLSTTTRAAFSVMILKGLKGKVLEIGPLNLPIVRGPQCTYFDIIPTAELKEKAKSAGLDSSTVPNIDYWHSSGDLSVIPDSFNAIVSSHCIEHQADLIHHLNQVSKLLDEGGKYFLVIPDQRYCFDHFLPPSRIMEIISAHQEGRRMPPSQSIIEHHTFVTHNDPVRHWKGDHGSATDQTAVKWKSTSELVSRRRGEYVDVHCWQFQPETFADLITNLFNLELISLKCSKIFTTARNDLEFFAVLEKD
jgi:hypothetical protein